MTAVIHALRKLLDQDGPNTGELKPLLARAWPDLLGGEDTSMDSRKLDRIEEPKWTPPILSFRIERHGAMVGGGSSRAEVQSWEVDLDASTASVVHSTWRQVRPVSPRFDAQGLADELVALVDGGAEDSRLEWSEDRSTVRIALNKIEPLSQGFKDTLAGRRRRFAPALDSAMAQAGWHRSGNRTYVYSRRSL
jgi:hypothetical protein